MRTPLRILLPIIRDMLADQNVSGIAAIHHSLRDVDASASDIRLFVQIGDFVDRAAVNSHSHPKFGMILELLANLDRAQNRRFGAIAEHQRAAVASWQS